MAATVAFAAVGILVAKISSLTRAAFNGAMPVRYVKRTRRDNNQKDLRIIESVRGRTWLSKGAKNSIMSRATTKRVWWYQEKSLREYESTRARGHERPRNLERARAWERESADACDIVFTYTKRSSWCRKSNRLPRALPVGAKVKLRHQHISNVQHQSSSTQSVREKAYAIGI